MVTTVKTASWVTIIIPVHNHGKDFYDCLRSVKKQTYQNFDIVLVDDGSEVSLLSEKEKITNLGFCVDDGSKGVASRDSFSVQIVRQENAGAAAARNAGFSYAKGEYVLFLDDDILCRPDMLKKMVSALEKDLGASFVYSNFYFGKKKMPAQVFNVQALRQCNYISTMSLIRTKDFPGFDPVLLRFQDWDLWLTMVEKGSRGVWIDAYLFQAIPQKFGISTWLPSWSYRVPWKYFPGINKKVRRFEGAKKIIEKKHGM